MKNKAMRNERYKRTLTKGEEIFNAVTHAVGGVLAVAALIAGIIIASTNKGRIAVFSMAVFGFTMIVLYSMSSIYHSLRHSKAKRVFKVLDHCGIYLLIAGTYTPYCLMVMHGVTAAYAVLGFVWTMSVIGIALNAVNMNNKYVKVFSYISYIALGWCVAVIFKPLTDSLSICPASFWLLLAGGVTYTVGFVFYALSDKVKYIHPVWHLFVLAGSVTHFLSLLLFLVA